MDLTGWLLRVQVLNWGGGGGGGVLVRELENSVTLIWLEKLLLIKNPISIKLSNQISHQTGKLWGKSPIREWTIIHSWFWTQERFLCVIMVVLNIWNKIWRYVLKLRCVRVSVSTSFVKVKLMMQRIQPAPLATCVMKKVETFDMQVLLLCGNFTFPIINFVLNKPQ